ncbi:MAG: MFS transporter, partial [Bacteroidota bacterium]
MSESDFARRPRYHLLITLAVSLGGFLFGFDAAVISGVTGYIVPEFSLDPLQLGWVVACLTLAASIAMLVSGPLSDRFGRKPILLLVGLFYAVSALFSALAPNYETLIVARMIGGLAVGAALILAPMYIAETAPAEHRGKMVSIQQLNIVLGFSAAYFSNYLLLQLAQSPYEWVSAYGIDTQT